jgi:hypothetical protein
MYENDWLFFSLLLEHNLQILLLGLFIGERQVSKHVFKVVSTIIVTALAARRRTRLLSTRNTRAPRDCM